MAGPTGFVDSRGLRFSAVITAVVLAVVMVTSSAALLAIQAVVFAVGAFGGLRRAPYGVLFRRAVAPRLGPSAELEPEQAPRSAQGLGLAFAIVGVVGYAVGLGWLGIIATAAAWVAAFLNAAFGFCLGCEIYLLSRRLFTIRKGVPA
jgi:Domain of unknown function (DUF4395)